MPGLRDVSKRELAVATECVIGCCGDRYHVPGLPALKLMMTALTERLHAAREFPQYRRVIPHLLEDLDRLMERWCYYSMMPDGGAPVDGR